MARVEREVRCPACGFAARVRVERDRYQNHFECSRCTTRFSLTEHPDREVLEEKFLNDELPSGPVQKVYQAARNALPFQLPTLGKPGKGRRPGFLSRREK